MAREAVEALEGFFELGQAQQRALRFLLSGQGARVGLSGVQGYAGTGKSTMLKVYKAGLDEAGKTVKVFAPSHQALSGLIEKGFEGVTVQKLLASRDIEEVRRLGFTADVWVVDESSMLSTKEMSQLVALSKAVGAQLRLVGDVEQLAAVNAGSPFAQMQRAGMPTVALDEILRQRRGSTTLQQAVDDAAKISSARAVKTLLRDEHIEEVKTKGRRNLYSEMARRAMALRSESGELPLVLFPTHRSRGRFHREIRERLKRVGAIERSGMVAMCRSAVSLTNSELKDCRSYKPGQKLRSGRRDGWTISGFESQAVLEVVGLDQARNAVLVVEEGRAEQDEPRALGTDVLAGAEVFERKEREFCVGERVVFHEHLRRGGTAIVVAKNTTGVVQETLSQAGALRVRVGDEDFLLDRSEVEGLGYGYSATNHAMQGASREHVLVGMPSRDRQLISHEAFYVAISRAEKNLEVFTDDKAKLASWTEKSGAQLNVRDEAGLAKTQKRAEIRASLGAFFGSLPTLNHPTVASDRTSLQYIDEAAAHFGTQLVIRDDLARLGRSTTLFTRDPFDSDSAGEFIAAFERVSEYFTKLSDRESGAKIVLPALKELRTQIEVLERMHTKEVVEETIERTVVELRELGESYLNAQIAVYERELGETLEPALHRLEEKTRRHLETMNDKLGEKGTLSKQYATRLGYNIDVVDSLVRYELGQAKTSHQPLLRERVARELARFQAQRSELLEHADGRGLELESLERALLRRDGPLLSQLGADVMWRNKRLGDTLERGQRALEDGLKRPQELDSAELGPALAPHKPIELTKQPSRR